jgi:hypothetical protein
MYYKKTLTLFFVLLHLQVFLFASEILEHPKKCQELKILTESFTKLSQSDWVLISQEVVQNLWPGKPVEESKNDSRSLLMYREQFSNQHCECCETFDFELSKDKNSERLMSVTIFYSFLESQAASDAAKSFLAATGLPSTAKMTGDEGWSINMSEGGLRKSFWWVDKVEVLHSVEIQIYKQEVGPYWILSFAYGRPVYQHLRD